MALRATLADEDGPCSRQWDGQPARQGGGDHPADRLAAGPTGLFSRQSPRTGRWFQCKACWH